MKGLLSLVVLTIWPCQLLAWGQEGHSIVAEIAQRHVSSTTAAAIKRILGGEASLASISSWADDVRNQRPETYNWYFVDIPLSQTTYDAALYCTNIPRKGDCIINAIDRTRVTLADETAANEQRAEAPYVLGPLCW
jgi:hypothetical protein